MPAAASVIGDTWTAEWAAGDDPAEERGGRW